MRSRAARWQQAEWWVAALAALIQLIYLLDSRRDLAFQLPVVDSATYHQQAVAIASGVPAPRDAFWQPPLYPYLLGAMYGIGVREMGAVRAVHALALIATAVLIVRIGRRFLPPWGAAAAGLATAAYGPLVFFATQLLPTGVAVTLDMLALLLLLRFTEHPSMPRALLLGAAVGLAALAVPNVLVCLGIPLVWVWRRRRQFSGGNRVAASRAAIVLTGACLVIAPVTIRNRVVSGAWVPISANAGINLYIGNNPQWGDTVATRPGTAWDRLVARPYARGAVSSAEAQSFFMHEVAHYISSEPLHFIGGLAQKCWLLLGSVEEPRNIDLYTFRARTRSLRPLAWHIGGFGFPFAVVAGLAFCGLVHWRRWGTAQLAVLGWTALYAASVLLFFPAARYRLPLLPPLIALAVAGGYDLVKDWRDGNRLGPLLLLTAGTLLVSWPRRSPTAETSFDAELDRNLGVALQVRGDRDGAIAQYTAALHLDPGDADTMFYLATALRDSGRLEPAREAFESCLAVQPDHERALHDLGVMCYEAGDVEHSAELLRRALDVNPRYVRAMRNLMVAELRLGNTREAEALRQRIEAATIRMPIE